jgi:hypothetical protein
MDLLPIFSIANNNSKPYNRAVIQVNSNNSNNNSKQQAVSMNSVDKLTENTVFVLLFQARGGKLKSNGLR